MYVLNIGLNEHILYVGDSYSMLKFDVEDWLNLHVGPEPNWQITCDAQGYQLRFAHKEHMGQFILTWM